MSSPNYLSKSLKYTQSALLNKPENTKNYLEKLIGQILELQSLLKNQGILTRVSPAPFSRLGTTEMQIHGEKLIQMLDSRIKITKMAVESGTSLRDTRSLVWLACSNLRLRPPLDFLNKIRDTSVFEIYSLNFTQLFSNFKFWELVSYSIDDILTVEFDRLYKREDSIRKHILQTVNDCIRSGKVIEFDNRSHTMIESLSDAPKAFQLKLEYCSPLWDRDQNQVTAFASTIEVESVF
jgi:hypothetical protein